MKKARILVVEDEVSISNLLKKVIELGDFSVDVASDGKSGLNKAKNGEYDLIVLDIMLPELNGLEVCKELRSRNVVTPIIILTAKDTAEDRLIAKDAGANDYLAKPFSFIELLDRISLLLATESIKGKNVSSDKRFFNFGENRRKHDGRLAEFNKRIMDNIPVSIITIDRDGNINSANKFFKNLSGREDFQNVNVFNGNFFVRENLVNDYKKLLSDGTMVKRDYCYEMNYSGEDKYLKIIAVPLLDNDGNIEGALSMALDNTESVLYRKKLQLLNDELEKKVEDRTKQLDDVNTELAKVLDLKSMFIADVSHEMRTSMAIVQGNIELMSRGLLEEKDAGEAYGQVFGEIRRMTSMLSDMTLLSESKTSLHNLECEKIEVNELIATICKSLQVVAKEKKIKIKHKNSKIKIEVIADKTQIEKMMMNLVRNAIRYNKENGIIEVSVRNLKGEVLISVKDSGVGIEKQHLGNIFERFYRVDKARSRSEGGSGLGLAICKWVAEIHGGKIEVKSTVGEGSTFTVCLPGENKYAQVEQSTR